MDAGQSRVAPSHSTDSTSTSMFEGRNHWNWSNSSWFGPIWTASSCISVIMRTPHGSISWRSESIPTLWSPVSSTNSAKESVDLCGGCNAHRLIPACNMLTVSIKCRHFYQYPSARTQHVLLCVRDGSWCTNLEGHTSPVPQSCADGEESAAFRADSQ